MAIAAPPDGDPLFEEITAFIASSPSLEQIIDFEPPESLQQRLSDLLERNRQDALTVGEKIELDKFLQRRGKSSNHYDHLHQAPEPKGIWLKLHPLKRAERHSTTTKPLYALFQPK